MKSNGSIHMRLEMAGMGEDKQKYLNLIVVPRFRIENQITSIS